MSENDDDNKKKYSNKTKKAIPDDKINNIL